MGMVPFVKTDSLVANIPIDLENDLHIIVSSVIDENVFLPLSWGFFFVPHANDSELISRLENQSLQSIIVHCMV